MKLCNRRHCPFVALILLVSLPFLNAVALFHSDFSFLFSMTMSLTTCPVSVIGHLSTLPLHAHYAIHLPFAFHALAHPCFCPLLSTSLLLPTTLLLASELNSCLSLSFTPSFYIPINIEKSAALYIHPSAPIRKVTSSTSTPTVLLNGTPIKIVTEMRVLGVIVDNKLSWSPHVESVISKVCRKIGILQRNKHQLRP